MKKLITATASGCHVPSRGLAANDIGLGRNYELEVEKFAQGLKVPRAQAIRYVVRLRTLLHNWIVSLDINYKSQEDDCRHPLATSLLALTDWIDENPEFFFSLDERITSMQSVLVPVPAVPPHRRLNLMLLRVIRSDAPLREALRARKHYVGGNPTKLNASDKSPQNRVPSARGSFLAQGANVGGHKAAASRSEKSNH